MTEQAATVPNLASMPVSTPESTERRCPWCSQPLPPTATDQCPSCHANLVSTATASENMPGLTAVESDTATRIRRAEAPKRSKLLAWISGDIDEESLPPSEAAAEAFAPPSKDVRREIWRLTLEAEGLEVMPDGEIVLPGAPAADAPAQDAPAATAAPPTPMEAVASSVADAPTTSPAPVEAVDAPVEPAVDTPSAPTPMGPAA
jgi:hypothetical protein